MQIYRDMLKLEKQEGEHKNAGRLQVVDTLQLFLRQFGAGFDKAKVMDASILLDSVAEICRYTYQYEHNADYGNIAPVAPGIWLELTDKAMAFSLAALLLYEENDGQQDLRFREQLHNRGAFRWRCRIRCLIKIAGGPVLPLKWEWIEYVAAKGCSAGSYMQPVQVPEGLRRMIDEALEQAQFVEHDLCALVANLSLYTVDMLNQRIATLRAYSSLPIGKGAADRHSEFAYDVVALHFGKYRQQFL